MKSLLKAFLLSVCTLSSTLTFSQQIGDAFPSSIDLIIAGVNAHDAKDYKTAISKYQLVLTGDSLYDLALYEKALSCIADGQFERAVDVTKLILEYPNNYHFESIMLQGSALESMEKWDEAEAAFTKGIEMYPLFYRAYYERAAFYLKAKKFDLALKDANKALEMNFFHSRSHRLIGLLAAEADQPTLAVMALYTGLLVEQIDVDNALVILQTIESIGADNYTKQYEVDPSLMEHANVLAGINQIIKSKAPLSPAYKSKVKSNFNYMRVMQAVCEKLPTKVNTDDRMLKIYSDFYKYVWDNNLFAGMVYYPLGAFQAKEIQSSYKKNIKKVNTFGTKSRVYLDALSEKKDYKVGDKIYNGHYYVFNDKSFGIGDIVNNTQDGEWCYFHSNGVLSATGKLNMNTPVGKWTYYHENGSLQSEIDFNNEGLYNGFKKDYSAIGVLSASTEYTKGNYDGVVKNYRWNGSQLNEYEVSNNVLIGFIKLYDDAGNLSALIEIRNNERNGSYKEFYADGKVSVEATNLKGEFNGPYKVYYHDGSVQLDGGWKNGQREGTWTWYHPNGKVQTVMTYKDGKAEGESIDYNDEGLVEMKSNYKQGKLEGVRTYYDRFEKVFSEWTFKGDKLKASKYFNYDGSVLVDNQFEGRKFKATIYNEFRKISSEGQFVNELKEGEWIYYSANGALASKINYVNGVAQGRATYYHTNGKVASEFNNVDDNLDGYYRRYYSDGTLSEDGYYKNGEPHGYFRYMAPDGKLTETKFFWNGMINGWNVDYDTKENTFTRLYYNFGLNEITESYDSKGNFINKSLTPQGNGLRKLYGEGNFVRNESELRNGALSGNFKAYTNTGVVTEVRESNYGMTHGKINANYPTGVKSIEGQFKFNERDSIWNFYTETGELNRSFPYRDGEANGIEVRYDVAGKKTSERSWKDGDLNGYIYYYGNDGSIGARIYCTNDIFISYSYLGKDGKYVPEIELMDNGHAVCYYQNGKKSLEFTLVNGYYDKEYRRYDVDGKVLVESNYVDGEENGTSKDYYNNGKLKWEENYSKGQKNGITKIYYPNGKLCVQYTYNNNEKEGPASFYDKNGKLILTGEYINGYFVEK